MTLRRTALLLVILMVAVMGAHSRALADDDGPDPGHVHGNGHTHHLPSQTDADAIDVSNGASSGAIVTGNMTYHGGPVVSSLTAYSIFWEPSGNTFETAGDGNYKTDLDAFFMNVTGSSGSSYYNILTQYSQNPSTGATITGAPIANLAKFGGGWTDTTAFPETTLQDKDIQAEVSRAISKNLWSTTNSEFFVFTPLNVHSCDGASCAFTNYCAYHGYFAASGKTLLYASVPDPGTNLLGCSSSYSPSGDVDADSAINLISHEQSETVSDPQLTAWYDANGNEIGDKCAWTFGPTVASNADVTLNKVNYMLQEEWSNAASTCAISYATPLPPAPVVSTSVSTVVASSSSISVSKPGTITVTLKTAGGAVVTGKTVKLTASSSTATISPASGMTNANGVITFALGDSKAETVSYTATDVTDGLTLTTKPSIKW